MMELSSSGAIKFLAKRKRTVQKKKGRHARLRACTKTPKQKRRSLKKVCFKRGRPRRESRRKRAPLDAVPRGKQGTDKLLQQFPKRKSKGQGEKTNGKALGSPAPRVGQ